VVAIPPPPPARRPRPRLHELVRGARLVRVFDPTRHGATATGFRHHGPRHRFDHHRGRGRWRSPADDPARAVYYAAFSLSGCVVEVFGDAGVVHLGEQLVAGPHPTRPLQLLDLRGSGAMRAGSVAALAKTADRRLSQAWARHFYDAVGDYGRIDGLLYANAHNDEPAVVLFERAADALACPDERIMRLDDPLLRPAVTAIALTHNLVVL